MCEVIQLLYSNECTRDKYPFNGQMRTGTALVVYNDGHISDISRRQHEDMPGYVPVLI